MWVRLLNDNNMCDTISLLTNCSLRLLQCLLLFYLCLRSVGHCIIKLCSKCLTFVGGLTLGQLYYYYLLRDIGFPHELDLVLCTGISIALAMITTACAPLRCISLLTVPMYCGKPGRGVLKAVVLTYVIAGPITNMCLNAREVVRVFDCATQLSHNLTIMKHDLLNKPLQDAMNDLRSEIGEVKDTLSTLHDVVAPIESELEDHTELEKSRKFNDMVDDMFGNMRRSHFIENKFRIDKSIADENTSYQREYLKKVEYRCHAELSRGAKVCADTLRNAFRRCYDGVPKVAGLLLCWPLKVTHVCNVMHLYGNYDVCDSEKHMSPGLGESYVHIKKAKEQLTNFKDVQMQYSVTNYQELVYVQDAKETGERVLHAFDEKAIIMRSLTTVVKICVSLLFLRVLIAACTYHDRYLTSIDYDNVYITGYFKELDWRRRCKDKYTILPLKKMERTKYIDIHALATRTPGHGRMLTQVLKVMLEVITATTFIMLDRLFYEALDVVRQHAEMDSSHQGIHDLEVEVEGSGMLSTLVRRIVLGLQGGERVPRVSNDPCLPRPRTMPRVYYVKIYGGYLWIVLLLYLNPYTSRIKRLICSYFYPRREKQRILHLYNDILKKRMKMPSTLRKKAVQAIRAHYLSGENLLSLRIKFPHLLGWLRIFPVARMKCLICGETEPGNKNERFRRGWYSCPDAKCPFVNCAECWREVGARCLACEPGLAELSDVDSLSEDELPRY